MTTPQGQVPPPPEGYASWLDCLIDGPLMRARYDLARAELADLRKELADTKAQLALQAANTVEAMQQRDEATGQLDDISSVSGHSLMLDDADHEAPRLPDWIDGIVKERDALRAQVAELNEMGDATAKRLSEMLTNRTHQLNEARDQVQELREAVLDIAGAGFLGIPTRGEAMFALPVERAKALSALVAKLRAEPAPKEEKQP